MMDINKAILVRLKKGGENFEVLVDCEKAIEFKSGKIEDIREVLAAERIYKDAKKGDKASENEMEKIFGSSDVKEIAREIIKKGEMHVTAEHKAKLRESKKKRLIELIHRNAVDSKTGLPHPVKRIEAAMEEARVHIDEDRRNGRLTKARERR